MTAASQAGSVRLIHATALSGTRCPCRNPASKARPVSRGARRAKRCVIRFVRNVPCFETLASGGAGPQGAPGPATEQAEEAAPKPAERPSVGKSETSEPIASSEPETESRKKFTKSYGP